MRTTAWKMPVALAALALIFLGSGALSAQQGDLLEDTKARLAVEAQRLEKVCRDAERDALRVGKEKPAEAVDILKTALGELEADKALKPEQRERMKRALRLLLKDFEFEVTQRKAGLGSNIPVRAGLDSARRAEEERRKAQADEIKKTFDRRADQLADSRRIGQERAQGRTNVGLSVERSFAAISDQDVTFPKDWLEKVNSKHRSTIRITEREKAIMKALNSVISVDFENNTFQDVINYLEKKLGQPILVDRQSLTDANVTYEGTQITRKVQKATLRTVLRSILADVGLTYVVKDEVLQVMTPAKAKETLSVRTYYIGDMLGVAPDARFGPIQTRLQAANMINQLAVLITRIVEPDSWEVNDKGGLGTIVFNPLTMSFVVKQTAEIHFMMGFGFR